MNVRERFGASPPDTFAPSRPQRFSWRSIGATRLALKVAIFKIVGLMLLLIVVLERADLPQRAVSSALESLIVQGDTIAAVLEGAGSDRALPMVRLVPPATPVAGGPIAVTEIDRNRVERLFADVLEGSLTRAQLYGVTGDRLADSVSAIRGGSDVASAPLPPLLDSPSAISSWRRGLFGDAEPATTPVPAPTDADEPAALSEVIGALGGVKTVRRGQRPSGDTIVAVATPILDDDGRVAGALRVVSPPELIDSIVREQERSIIDCFLIAAIVAVGLAMLLAATVARPLTRLARAAETIKRGSASAPIPELNEPGEIGDLSRVLNEMTVALYTRIDAIDAFAGEVAHELRNPLTSLRSAVETLPLARNDAARKRLLDIIVHDVRRIDRLITDISDASKLDAELNRYRFDPVDLIGLLRTVTDAQDELGASQAQHVTLSVRGETGALLVRGNDSRLGQVFTNLIQNARSFTPVGGTVAVTAVRFSDFVEIVVDDEGPGIDEAVMERIFERFYTDRPHSQGFGDNSGLGLSISRQIIEAHRGEIFAENRYRTTLMPDRDVAGARLTVRLPLLD